MESFIPQIMSGAACEIASAASDGCVVVSDDARVRQVFASEARGAEPRGCFDLLAASSRSESSSNLTRRIMADGRRKPQDPCCEHALCKASIGIDCIHEV